MACRCSSQAGWLWQAVSSGALCAGLAAVCTALRAGHRPPVGSPCPTHDPERAMPLTLSCAFATSPDSPEHALVAEDLGYQNAYFYDSPPLYPDVWVQLCRAAERTT